MIVKYTEETKDATEKIELEMPRGEAVSIHRIPGRVSFLEATDGKGKRFFLMNAAPDTVEGPDGKDVPYNYFIKINRTENKRRKDYFVRITDSAQATLLNRGKVSHTLEDAVVEIRLL